MPQPETPRSVGSPMWFLDAKFWVEQGYMMIRESEGILQPEDPPEISGDTTCMSDAEFQLEPEGRRGHRGVGGKYKGRPRGWGSLSHRFYPDFLLSFWREVFTIAYPWWGLMQKFSGSEMVSRLFVVWT